MKLIRHVLIPVLCLLVLATAAMAALNPPVKLTREQARDYYRNFRASAPQTATAPRSLYNFPAPNAVQGAPSPVITSSKYRAIQLLAGISPGGIGVGVLGDWVLISDFYYGLLGYERGQVRLLNPMNSLSAGRMRGNYYFGDDYGNIYRLEPDQRTVTPVWMTWDEPGLEVGSLDVDPVTGFVYFALNVDDGYCVDFWILNPSTEDIYYVGRLYAPYCYGLALKGNYMYFSLWHDDIILRWNRVKGGDLYEFVYVPGPGDIIFDAAGNLLVLEHDDGNIVRYNPLGTGRSKIAWGIPGPTYIGLDKFGDIFFSDYYGELWKLKKR